MSNFQARSLSNFLNLYRFPVGLFTYFSNLETIFMKSNKNFQCQNNKQNKGKSFQYWHLLLVSYEKNFYQKVAVNWSKS